MQAAPSLRWAVAAQTVVLAESEPASAGEAIATFDGPPSGMLWRVEMLTVSLSPASGSSVYVYEGRRHPQFQLAGTYQGDFNVWEAAGTPLTVSSAQPLIIVWQGASAEAVGSARAQIRIEYPIPSSTAHPLLG